jgi:hypothetical protein
MARPLVGLNLIPADVPNVKQRLGIGTPLGEASEQEILDLVRGGAVIELNNGWRLTTARIAGHEVLEVVLNGVPANREELLGYGLSEENHPLQTPLVRDRRYCGDSVSPRVRTSQAGQGLDGDRSGAKRRRMMN